MTRRGVRPILFACLLAAAPATAETVARPDLRAVDANTKPWSSIGRVNNSAYGRCSAILVAPQVAVTAAHCLFNKATGRFLQPASIHVLFGFDRGRYGFHATARRVEIADGYDGAASFASARQDFAILQLVETVPERFPPARLRRGDAAPGTSVVAAGFAQERSEVLTASASCRVVGDTARDLLITDCAISHGFSGGPIFEAESGEVVGLAIATGRLGSTERSFAIPAKRLEDALLSSP